MTDSAIGVLMNASKAAKLSLIERIQISAQEEPNSPFLLRDAADCSELLLAMAASVNLGLKDIESRTERRDYAQMAKKWIQACQTGNAQSELYLMAMDEPLTLYGVEILLPGAHDD